MNLSSLIRSVSLYLVVIACCYPVCAQQVRNPLLEMVGREPCGIYYDEYESLCDSMFLGDSLGRVELVRLFTEAAAADPTGLWELDRRRIAGHVRFYESREGGYMPSPDYTAERFAQDLLDISRTAENNGFLSLRLRALFNAAAVYRIFAQEYEQAFACYLAAADGAAEMPLSEFPWKFSLYIEIADFYFSFREYEDAGRFYRMIADDPEMAGDQQRLYPALNGLGLCYRYAEEYDKSDSCFKRILELAAPVADDRCVWEGIAGGNIGYNYYLRGDDTTALAWMKPALGKMKRPDDDSFASKLASNIARIYLQRNDLHTGKKYLDISLEYHRRSRRPEKESGLLEVETRYHALQGASHEALAYLDSTIRAKEREQEAYSGLVLRRVEQQLRAADRKMHEERLGAEKMRTRFYRNTAALVACALAVILFLLIMVAVYYRRTRKAYLELVRKSQQWAGVETGCPAGEALPRVEDGELADHPGEEDGGNTPESSGGHTPDGVLVKETSEPAAFDREIMQAVETAVIRDKMFKQADLTLDMLSATTGYSRYYLSAALNRCAGVNFNAYVNEQRIKEAVRLMSDPANSALTVEAVAFDAGFNDRKNFYKVFKKVTGLSPTQFRRNISA